MPKCIPFTPRIVDEFVFPTDGKTEQTAYQITGPEEDGLLPVVRATGQEGVIDPYYSLPVYSPEERSRMTNLVIAIRAHPEQRSELALAEWDAYADNAGSRFRRDLESLVDFNRKCTDFEYALSSIERALATFGTY